MFTYSLLIKYYKTKGTYQLMFLSTYQFNHLWYIKMELDSLLNPKTIYDYFVLYFTIISFNV